MAGLSDRYASALLSLAVEDGVQDLVLEQVSSALETLRDEECLLALEHPHIPDSEKRGLISALFGGGLNEILKNFLFLLISKSRERMIIPALTEYVAMSERLSGKTAAAVVSAEELGEIKLARIKNLLSEKLKKRVEIVPRTDESLLGGFYVLVDGYMIDLSLKRRLKDLKDYLKAEQVVRDEPQPR